MRDFKEEREQMLHDYRAAKRRLILLDYDGTLVPFADRPEHAVPGSALLVLLHQLCAENTVYIVSGRDRNTMEQWLGQLPLGLVAEHGAMTRTKDGIWQMLTGADTSWKDEFGSLLREYEHRFPGSITEEKEFSLSWHYRSLDEERGALAARVLADRLDQLIAGTKLEVLRGNKVIELRTEGANKESACTMLVQSAPYDFIFSAGDDVTDEGMFRSLAVYPFAYTYKVGASAPTVARFRLHTQQELPLLLQELVVG